MLDALEPLAWDLENGKEYKAALDCRKKVLLLLDKIQPPRPFQQSTALGEGARDMCHLNQYQEAEVWLKRAIAIGEAHHYKRQLQTYVQLYGQMLVAANRKDERDRLFAKYHAALQAK
jgi:hypothetical protein